MPLQGITQFSEDGQYAYTFDWKKVRWPSLEVVGQFPLTAGPATINSLYSYQNFAIDEAAGVMLIFGGSRVGVFDLNTFQAKPSSKILYADGYAWIFYSAYIVEKGKYFLTYAKYTTPGHPPYLPGETHYWSFLWDIRTMDTTTQAYPVRRLGGPMKQSPDGLWLGTALGSNPNVDSILVFNTSTYEATYMGEPDHGLCKTPSVDWSHDSKYFVTSSWGCNTPASICVWDVIEGKSAYKYAREFGADVSMHVSPDNKYILLVSSAGLGLFNFITRTNVYNGPKSIKILYPNPTSGEITLPGSNFNEGKLNIELTALDGNLIDVLYDGMYQGGDLRFNLAELSQGIYFIQVTQNKSVQTYKVIKEK